MLVWLVAMITYVIFEMVSPGVFETWLIFIYAFPVSTIVALVFNNLWGNRIYNMVIVSALDWGISLSFVLTMRNIAPTSWYLYFVSAIFELMVIIWYLLDLSAYTESKRKKHKLAKEAKAKHKEEMLKKLLLFKLRKNYQRHRKRTMPPLKIPKRKFRIKNNIDIPINDFSAQ